MLLAGGAVVYSCCMQTVYNILHEYRIHNAEVLFRDDCSMDEFIDVIEGNRKYVRCLYVWNKVRRGRRTKKKAWGQGGWAAAWSCRGCVPSLRWCCRLPAYLPVVARFCLPQSIWIRRTHSQIDTVTMEDVDRLAREPHSIVIGCNWGLNLDRLIDKMWDYLRLTRVYTKKRVRSRRRRGRRRRDAAAAAGGERFRPAARTRGCSHAVRARAAAALLLSDASLVSAVDDPPGGVGFVGARARAGPATGPEGARCDDRRPVRLHGGGVL